MPKRCLLGCKQTARTSYELVILDIGTQLEMEWSKEKTMKLIELLQANPSLWNPALCDTRRDKQKRKEELRSIAEILCMSIPDTTKKIQHLRTQYNRESAREARANADDPHENYISNWYAYDCLHFMKDPNKPYSILHSEDHSQVNSSVQINADSSVECKMGSYSPPQKIQKSEVKPEIVYTTTENNRDEFSVFGEYIANELRSLRGEKHLLLAKKKIQDAIFDVKMGLINDSHTEQTITVFHQPPVPTSLQNPKWYSSPVMSTSSHMEPLPSTHTPPTVTSQISEIIISGTNSFN